MNKSITVNPALIFSLLFGYFSCSVLLFLLFWIKIWIAIPLASLLLFSIYLLIKEFYNTFERISIPKVHLFVVILVSIGSLILVGFGGFFEQKYDLFCRSGLLFSKLVYHDWPIYSEKSSNLYLSYYFGYFLVPAGLTKLLGISSFLFIELIINSILLGSILLLFLLKYRNFYFLLAFLPSGLFWLIERIFLHGNSGFRFFEFLNVLAHGPQQLFPSLLGILCWFWFNKDLKKQFLVFIFSLLFFWSPFATLGLIIIFLLDIVHVKFNFQTFLGCVLLFVFLFFFTGKEAPIYFRFIDFSSEGIYYLLFVVFDLLLLLFLFKPAWDRTFSIIVAFLICLPIFHFGKHNDLFSKASVPAIIFFYLYLIKNSKFQLGSKWMLFILFFYSFSSLNQMLNWMNPYQGDVMVLKNLNNKSFLEYYDQEVEHQFYSKTSSIFGSFFLKK